MAAFDEDDSPYSLPTIERGNQPRRARSAEPHPDLTWNGLTVLVWLGMAIMVLAFVSIYREPSSRFNPLKPQSPTLVAAIVIPTATIEATRPTATPTETPTLTPLPPTQTPTPSPAPTDTPTPGPTPTPTIKSAYPFIPLNDPVIISGSVMPGHDSCKLWVAGQAYDLQNAPMVGITVQLGGTINGRNLDALSLTGTALQFGRAGYEFEVAPEPVRSRQTAWVQLLDQARIPLSGRILFDTDADCEKNLILIHFRQIR
jgi:hypothetical protein